MRLTSVDRYVGALLLAKGSSAKRLSTADADLRAEAAKPPGMDT
jgi:hypothetical protein